MFASMRRVSLLFSFLFLLCGLSAQTPAPAADTVQPFEGTIGYLLSFSGDNSEGIKSLLPDSLTLWVKAPWVKMTWHGGLADTIASETMWMASNNQYFLIDHARQVVWKMPPPADTPKFKRVATKETFILCGRSCLRHNLLLSNSSQSFWLDNTLIFMKELPPDSLRGNWPPFLAKGYREIPLMFTTKTETGSTTARAFSVQAATLDESLFRFPAGYELVEFDRLRFRHPIFPDRK